MTVYRSLTPGPRHDPDDPDAAPAMVAAWILTRLPRCRSCGSVDPGHRCAMADTP